VPKPEPGKPKIAELQSADGLKYIEIPRTSFAMSETETTVAAYYGYLKASGAKGENQKKGNFPVINVTLDDAEKYCAD
jgi:hypothetical protein